MATPSPRYFFRVAAGQIAQEFEPYLTAGSYIKLNELEARGEVPYQKSRLKGLSSKEEESLWRTE